MKVRHINPIVFTTSSSLWFRDQLPKVRNVWASMPNATVAQEITVVQVSKAFVPKTVRGSDGKMRMSHQWFEQIFTKQYQALGYNAFFYHISQEEKLAWGLQPTINGSYWNDRNDVYEAWFSADTPAEFYRLLLHEGGHGFIHFAGVDAALKARLGLPRTARDRRNGKKVNFSDVVHYCDYAKNDLEGMYEMIDYAEWNHQHYRRSLARELLALVIKEKNLRAANDAPEVLQPKTNREVVYQRALGVLGTDASPKDRAPDELGCAETVSEILSKVTQFPIITGTWTLWQYFRTDPRFVEVQSPLPGDIIISPTGTGNGRIVGHTGIVGTGATIMSNDSYRGTFLANFTMTSWRQRYVELGGFKMYYYRLK